jgi:hypothetical protein
MGIECYICGCPVESCEEDLCEMCKQDKEWMDEEDANGN